MASLQRYSVNGKSYYRIVESRRINGKPHAVPILHIGTAKALLERLASPLHEEVGVKSFEHGSLVALYEIVKELGVIPIINQLVPKKFKGVSCGDTLVLIALNRLLDPCSKKSWSDWARGTSLFRLFPHVPTTKLSSQFFWEHMQQMPEEILTQIEDALVQVTLQKYNLKLDLLFFDTTNCYTYVADPQDEESLFQYGHSKEGQDHRRIFGVELLVTRDSSIPIYHRAYSGNQHDSKLFPGALEILSGRLRKLALKPSDITLVFDRGMLSQDNFKRLDQSELGFVTALRLGDIPRDLFDIPLQKFRRTKKGNHKGILFYDRRVSLWGQERQAVFYISEHARNYQEKVLNDQINHKIKELSDWNATLINQAGHSDQSLAESNVAKKIKSLQFGPYLKDILKISFDPTLPRGKRLQFSVNEKAKADVILKYFGKRCLITNRLNWKPFQVIDAYFQQATVERAFQLTKNRHHISLRPQFHRTNQSTRVHVFSCFLALLLGQLLLKKAQTIDSQLVSLPALLQQLSSVRLAAILSNDKLNLKNPAVSWKLEKTEHKISELFSALSSDPI